MPPTPPVTDLPVEACVDELRRALADEGQAVLQAPPGAGKTTVVPLRLLDEGWLDGGRIVVLEPRRLAARAAAQRMADLLGEEVGATVGFRTRDERRVGAGTRIEVVTEGILTQQVQHDPSLPGVGLVVFDEVHERNLQGDLALALVLDARPVLRPDLRVLAMSATLDADRLAALLGGSGPDDGDPLGIDLGGRGSDGTSRAAARRPATVVTSEGRAHPVALRWRPPDPKLPPAESVAAVVREALRSGLADEQGGAEGGGAGDGAGDVLVFLAGAADIRRVGAVLGRGGLPPDVDVRPLFGALAPAEQDAALAPSPAGRRRVVLATDIAETSLTVAGVRVVVDAGEVRTPRFDPGSGLTRLRTGLASRASADQRAGRAGRTGPGVAYRCWAEAEHPRRPAHATPEIASVDLAGFALELARWGSAAADLPLLDQPPAGALAEARTLLVELGALGEDGRITDAGRAMATLPVHPRLARMVAAAQGSGEVAVACALAALLEERDVLRGRPEELPTDLAERVRLVTDDGATHARTDRAALALVRRRARELARRSGGGDRSRRRRCPTSSGTAGPAGSTGSAGAAGATGQAGKVGSAVDPASTGALVALAYPDRVAQARGGGRFRLRDGLAATLPTGDALTGEAFLVVADLGPALGITGPAGGDHRIVLAAAIDLADVEAAAGEAIEERVTLGWDDERDDLRVRTERRLGALVLARREGRADPGEATTAALLDRVRATRLGALTWTPAARGLQARAGFARRALGDAWPDCSDAALLAALDDPAGWLAPRLTGATGRADLARVDVTAALRDRVGHHRLAELDRVIPTRLALPAGRTAAVDYDGDTPAVAVRVQDLFGLTEHPTVGAGRIPVVLHLLSPAGRPVQITADLPGFWAGSWQDVRKEMAGRYPRHPWPVDPTTASPRPARPPRR